MSRCHCRLWCQCTLLSCSQQDNGHSFATVGKGNLKVKLPNGSDHTTMTLKDVIYAADLMFTLILVPHLNKAGYLTVLDGGMCMINSPLPNHKVIVKIPYSNSLYRIASLTLPLMLIPMQTQPVNSSQSMIHTTNLAISCIMPYAT